jgi:formate dehydrogenase maturation protein FdhE
VEPEAIPEVDEIEALSLDVWAREKGYEKIFPNLVGI